MFANFDQKTFLHIGGLILAVILMAAIVMTVYTAFKPFPVGDAEEAEWIYDVYDGPYLDLAIQLTNQLEELVPEVGIVQRDLLIARWTSFEAHIYEQPISSVDPLYLDMTFSTLESANRHYRALIEIELQKTPNEELNTYVLESLDFLDKVLAKLTLMRDSVVRYHEAIQ